MLVLYGLWVCDFVGVLEGVREEVRERGRECLRGVAVVGGGGKVLARVNIQPLNIYIEDFYFEKEWSLGRLKIKTWDPSSSSLLRANFEISTHYLDL